jgi:hypothetical protein
MPLTTFINQSEKSMHEIRRRHHYDSLRASYCSLLAIHVQIKSVARDHSKGKDSILLGTACGTEKA